MNTMDATGDAPPAASTAAAHYNESRVKSNATESASRDAPAKMRYHYSVGGKKSSHSRGLVQARDLSSMGRTRREINAIITDVLHLIDEQLRSHQQTYTGLQRLRYALPAVHQVIGLSNAEVVRIVNSKVIASLQERGFNTYHVNDNGRTMLYIEWEAVISEDESKSMQALLRDTERIIGPDGTLQAPPRRQVYDYRGRRTKN